MLRLAMLLAIVLAAPAGAYAGGYALKLGAATSSGEGTPAWVLQKCRPATGAEILGRFAGAGYWFYRATGDFCYFDRRPGVL